MDGSLLGCPNIHPSRNLRIYYEYHVVGTVIIYPHSWRRLGPFLGYTREMDALCLHNLSRDVLESCTGSCLAPSPHGWSDQAAHERVSCGRFDHVHTTGHGGTCPSFNTIINSTKLPSPVRIYLPRTLECGVYRRRDNLAAKLAQGHAIRHRLVAYIMAANVLGNCHLPFAQCFPS